MRTERRMVQCLLIALTAGLWFTVSAEPAQALTVKWLAIIGKNDNSGIDPRIPASVRSALQRAFNFNSYRLDSRGDRAATFGQKVSISLPGGHTLEVTPVKAQGEGASRRIQLEVGIVGVVSATVWLRPGRYFLIGGPTVDSGRLIVALAVLE